MSELLSCPFCGEKARIDRYEHFYRVLCTDCPASTEWLYSEQEAIDAWNTRAERTITPVLDDHDWPVWRCPDCGQPINRADRYCSSCGAKIKVVE